MMQDFSELHTPTGALGPMPAHKQDWQQYRLSDDQVEAFQPRRISGRRAGARPRPGRGAVSRAGGADGSVASHARALPRVPLERVQQSGYDPVSRAGRVAHRAGVSRRVVESGVSGGGVATAGRAGAILARPAFLQAGASRRRGGMAPGLLVLDADAADGAPDLLDRARRQHASTMAASTTCPEATNGTCCR